jgi:tetraacyldisaccharide 4'-kinase
MLGLNFAEHAFPDHHAYTAEDFAFNSCDAILLTEKDAVKCTAFADSRYWVLRVDAEIEASLIDHLLRKLIAHGPKAA